MFAAVCGGTISISSDTMTVVKSPGYDDAKSYQPYQECSWWIKVIDCGDDDEILIVVCLFRSISQPTFGTQTLNFATYTTVCL